MTSGEQDLQYSSYLIRCSSRTYHSQVGETAPGSSFLGSVDLVCCWVFRRLFRGMWQQVTWIQLWLCSIAWKPNSTSWYVAKSRESHSFLGLCWTKKLANLANMGYRDRFPDASGHFDIFFLKCIRVLYEKTRSQVQGSLAASFCSFILSVRNVPWTTNGCRNEIPMWNL